MNHLQELLEMDVSRDMKKDIELILKALDGIDVKKAAEAREMLEKIHGKAVEVEEYFWRPIDSTLVYERLKGVASQLGDGKKSALYDSKIKLFEANELEFKGRVQDFYGNKQKAIELYEQALKLAPDHELARPAHEKAKKSMEKARGDLAKTEAQLKGDPDNPKLLFKLGVAVIALGDAKKAIEYFERVIKLAPSDPEALAKRGTAMESLGDFDGSKEYFEKALKIKPSSLTAKRGLNYANYFLEKGI